MSQETMNQDHRENLSAAIDGELSGDQLRFVWRSLDHDNALQRSWGDYHVARDVLRGEWSGCASADFASRVMAAIDATSALAAAPRRNHWLRWSAGGAIAASVAAAALMVGQPTADNDRNTTLAAASRSSVATVASAPEKSTAPATVPPWLSGNSASALSQQASATLGAPFYQDRSPYARHLSAYPSMPRYRTLNNNDGSYLLLLDPQQQRSTARQAAR